MGCASSKQIYVPPSPQVYPAVNDATSNPAVVDANAIAVAEKSMGSYRLISLQKFKACGRMPRFPNRYVFDVNSAHERRLHAFDRERALVIFVSQSWIDSNSCAPYVTIQDEKHDSYDDDGSDAEFQLICDGATKLWREHASERPSCYLWLQQSCIDPNPGTSSELERLDFFVASADCVLTCVHGFRTSTRIGSSPSILNSARTTQSENIFAQSHKHYLPTSLGEEWEEMQCGPVVAANAHDQYVQRWWDMAKIAIYPGPGLSLNAEADGSEGLFADNDLRIYSRPEIVFAGKLALKHPTPFSMDKLLTECISDVNCWGKRSVPQQGVAVGAFSSSRLRSRKLLDYRGSVTAVVMRAMGIETKRREAFSASVHNMLTQGWQWRPHFLWIGSDGHSTLKITPPFNYARQAGSCAPAIAVNPYYYYYYLVLLLCPERYTARSEQTTEDSSYTPALDMRSGNGTVVYSNGGIFDGSFLDGKRHGLGTYTWPSGSQFRGEYNHGVREGYGVLETTLESYVGDWKMGARTGQARIVTATETFEGTVQNGCYVKGLQVFVNGDKYVGDFSGTPSNLKHGAGVFTWASGDSYEGGWSNDLQHGRGSYSYASGSKYTGNYVDGLMHGRGRYTSSAGDVYNGDFANDKKHGTGRYTWVSGDSYEGSYFEDKKQGQGRYNHSVSGEEYSGEWLQDKKQGHGCCKYASGDMYTGEVADGVPHGYGLYQYANGLVYEGYFKSGLQDGQGTASYPNGSVYTGFFKCGQMHGKGLFTRSDGSVYDGDYVMGRMEGVGTYRWPNGDSYTGAFKDDCRNGRGTKTYAMGATKTGLWAMDAYVEP